MVFIARLMSNDSDGTVHGGINCYLIAPTHAVDFAVICRCIAR